MVIVVIFRDDFHRECVANMSEKDGGPAPKLRPGVTQVLPGLCGLR